MTRQIERFAGEMRSAARREFLRATWDGASVSPHVNQDSAALSALAASNALIDRPARAGACEPGDAVDVYLLESGGIA